MTIKNMSEKTAKLDSLFNKLTASGDVHCAVATVESVDGAFSWRSTYGHLDEDMTLMQIETPFNIASVTKLFIAASILRLEEQGQLEIEQPISEHLPHELIDGIHRTKDGVDHTHKITIWHLLAHASGIPDYFEDYPKGEPRLADRMVLEGDQYWSIEKITEYVREKLVAHFPPQPIRGKKIRVRYSDTNYQLLTTIIQAITGQPHHQAFKHMFFEPLNMQHTFLPGTQPLTPTSPAARIWAGQDPLDLPLLLSSLGDLNSTIADQLTFMRALINGKAFTNPETAQKMRHDWHTFGLPTTMPPLSPNWPIQYGLGMMRFKMPLLLSPFRSVPAVIGHTGVSGSWLFYCPDLELLLAGTLNQINAAALPYRFLPKILQVMK
jgi:D-alanyl-D-alanine carboxypeptidase